MNPFVLNPVSAIAEVGGDVRNQPIKLRVGDIMALTRSYFHIRFYSRRSPFGGYWAIERLRRFGGHVTISVSAIRVAKPAT